MSMHPGAGRGGRTLDAAAQRAANADAPHVPDLLRRIGELFAPHRAALVVTIALVIVSAALSVLPPLLTKQAFDVGLFPPGGTPDVPVLVRIVLMMIVLWVATAALGVWQTYLTATVGNKVMGSLRVRLFGHLQAMELAFFTRTKTGVIQSRLQNDVGRRGRRAQQYDLERRRQHRHRHRRVREHARAQLAAHRRRRRAAARARDRPAPGRPGARPHRHEDAGVAQRHDRDNAGGTERLRHPAREELQPAGVRDRALRGGEREPDRAAGAPADERPVVLRDGQRVPVARAGDHLPRRRLPHNRRGGCHGRHDRRVHDRPGATDLPAHGPAAGGAGPADLVGALRPHLRVP